MRSGMDDLIKRLRLFTASSTADYSVGTVTYWTDDQLEDILDGYSTLVFNHRLLPVAESENGITVYKNFYLPTGDFEKADSGTAYFQIKNANGSAIGTAEYSVDYNAGLVTFSSSQTDTGLYLKARKYDLNGAASEVWYTKASQVWDAYNVSSDGQTFNRGEMYKHATAQAIYYKNLAISGGIVGVRRGDL